LGIDGSFSKIQDNALRRESCIRRAYAQGLTADKMDFRYKLVISLVELSGIEPLTSSLRNGFLMYFQQHS
jgi:hypothetical protein